MITNPIQNKVIELNREESRRLSWYINCHNKGQQKIYCHDDAIDTHLIALGLTKPSSWGTVQVTSLSKVTVKYQPKHYPNNVLMHSVQLRVADNP